MKAVLKVDDKPVHVSIIALQYNSFYDQTYVSCLVLKSVRGYKAGEIVRENQKVLYMRAAHFKDKYAFAGRPNLSNVSHGPDFKFLEM